MPLIDRHETRLVLEPGLNAIRVVTVWCHEVVKSITEHDHVVCIGTPQAEVEVPLFSSFS